MNYLRSILIVALCLCCIDSALAQDLRHTIIRNQFSGILMNQDEHEWVSQCEIKKQSVEAVAEKLFDIKEKIKDMFKDDYPDENIHNVSINSRMMFDADGILHVNLIQIKIFHLTRGYRLRGILPCQPYLVRPDWSILKQAAE